MIKWVALLFRFLGEGDDLSHGSKIRGFRGIPQSIQANTWIMPEVGSQPLPSTLLPFHSLFTKPAIV
jgi:hypothetical protein